MANIVCVCDQTHWQIKCVYAEIIISTKPKMNRAEQIIWANKINRNLFTMWHVQYWWFKEFIRFEHTFITTIATTTTISAAAAAITHMSFVIFFEYRFVCAFFPFSSSNGNSFYEWFTVLCACVYLLLFICCFFSSFSQLIRLILFYSVSYRALLPPLLPSSQMPLPQQYFPLFQECWHLYAFSSIFLLLPRHLLQYHIFGNSIALKIKRF